MKASRFAAWILVAAGLSAGDAAGQPRYDRYQELLDTYLVVTSDPGRPLETRFDYARLYDNPGRYERLTRIRRDLMEQNPAEMKAPERLAWAINTYNFLVIELVTGNLVDTRISKYRKREGWSGVIRSTVQQIKVDGQAFFDVPVIEIDDQSFSLNTLERKFVFGGYDPATKKPPPADLDPRAHFALVCAALGCPPLQPRAFRPDSLDAQLDRATRQALAHPAHLEFQPDPGILFGSSVFNWYVSDFGGAEGAYAFAQRHAPESLRQVMASRKSKQFDLFITWNWKLNIVQKEPSPASRDTTAEDRN